MNEEYFSHCKEEKKLLWLPSSEDEIRMASSSRQGPVAKDLLPFIPDDEEANKEQLHAAINHSGKLVAMKKVKKLLDELVAVGLIQVVEIPRSGTRAEVTADEIRATVHIYRPYLFPPPASNKEVR